MSVNYRCITQKSYIDLKVFYIPVIRIAYILTMLHTDSFLKQEFSWTSLFHRFPDTALALPCQVAKFMAHFLFTARAGLADQRQDTIAPFPSIPALYTAQLKQKKDSLQSFASTVNLLNPMHPYNPLSILKKSFSHSALFHVHETGDV